MTDLLHKIAPSLQNAKKQERKQDSQPNAQQELKIDISAIIENADTSALTSELNAFRDLIIKRDSTFTIVDNQEPKRFITYKVQSKEELQVISKKCYIPIDQILEANPGVLSKLDTITKEALSIKIPLNCGLRPDGAVYLCWYTQLRELINQYPKLAGELMVRPLPGGGIRGDWFLGVLKGSVSSQLGQTVINLLTNPTEDYKRFNLGLGLPMRSAFNVPGLKAWPGSTVDLLEIFRFHENALKRSDINNYVQVRHALANLCQELFVSEDFGSMISTLTAQLKAFTNSRG